MSHINVQIAKLLNISIDDCTEFTVHCVAQELPVVTIKKSIISDDGFKDKTTIYKLTEAKELGNEAVSIEPIKK